MSAIGSIVEKFRDDVLHVKFKKRDDLGQAFVRISEFYESPYLSGKTFTHDEFLELYSELNDCPGFYWGYPGYNLPDYIVDQFSDGRFAPLSFHEKVLIEEINKHKPKKKYYVIGTNGGSYAVTHELAHALYYLEDGYRKKMDFLMDQFSSRFVKSFWIHGPPREIYSDAVIDDEFQAYMVGLSIEETKLIIDSHIDLIYEMKRCFDKYTADINCCGSLAMAC